ncbi:DUF2721 domain-containing protein [Phormidesmis priestleyi ULC007]|uniref:DUF2721 domain-containing protein n=2 Tax=Phormidesmis priestleyi TaxID=268141 RepID=A0A2T1DCL1_9CYAN|nr:DUF2721 domain-containing protein [Phormidesmis priestleyi]PSB18215.1 DUF2721 domain-containing protein [Phormidesmis priestleyi ULC007]
MSVEQTTQLIQLILNSVLMIVACAFILAGLLLRRSALEYRLQTTSLEYCQVLHLAYESQGDRLLLLKKQLRHLQQQVKLAQKGTISIHYAFLVFVASTFTLSLRTVVDATWLITTALALFVVGIGILLLSVTLLLLDLHKSDRPFWQELKGMIELRHDRAGQRSIQIARSRNPKFTKDFHTHLIRERDRSA